MQRVTETMDVQQPRRIAVIGAGFMGCVIAIIYAARGHTVSLNDANPSVLQSFSERALPIAHGMALPEQKPEGIVQRVKLVPGLIQTLAGAEIVHEVIQEDLALKQALFAELDRLCAPDVILATNTSSFLLSQLCSGVAHKQRVIGIHYITPAHIIRVVEVITADFTPPELITWARNFVTDIGRTSVVCRESPGFVVNRIQMAMLCEIHRMIDEGLTTAEDIDMAIRHSLGPRWALWGALACEDLMASKSTGLAIMEYLQAQTGQEHFKPTAVLRAMVEEGKIGAISGCGWHRWAAPYSEIVINRDQHLSELLSWLSTRFGPSILPTVR